MLSYNYKEQTILFRKYANKKYLKMSLIMKCQS